MLLYSLLVYSMYMINLCVPLWLKVCRQQKPSRPSPLPTRPPVCVGCVGGGLQGAAVRAGVARPGTGFSGLVAGQLPALAGLTYEVFLDNQESYVEALNWDLILKCLGVG